LYCTLGTGKFREGFDDRFQAESGWNNRGLMLGKEDARIMFSFMIE
jgi:hypothetical protein